MASDLLGSFDSRLPNELTLAVVQQLQYDKYTLCQLAQTCRDFQQLAEEHIYKTIKLRSVGDLHRVIAAFAARHERVRAVQTLKILYRWNPRLEVSLERRRAFNECVAQMVNLRNWHIESPYDNFKWEKGGHEWVNGDMEHFRLALEKACVDGAQELARFAADRSLWNSMPRTVGLAQLESLTIHSHGAHADFWDLDGFHCLFRHPSLRYLHVSCVTFPETLDLLEPHKGTTPLTTLIFDECNIEPKSLKHLLSTPRQLKHLTIGENVFNVNRTVPLSPKLTPDPLAALEAIAPVAHSLETLTHLDSLWRLNPDKHLISRRQISGNGMRSFRSLTTLECDTDSFLHSAIIMTPQLCPPNLSTLILRRHFWVVENFFDHHPPTGIYTAIPSLTVLELRQSAASLNKHATADYICAPERLRSRHAYAYALAQHGINLRVAIELGRGSSLIPPYLHGEPAPEVQVLYDASRVGFRHRAEQDADADTYAAHDEDSPDDQPVVQPGVQADPPSPSPAAPLPADTPLTDTPLLPLSTIRLLRNTTHRLLTTRKARFTRGRAHRDPDWDSATASDSEFLDEDEDEDDDTDVGMHDGEWVTDEDDDEDEDDADADSDSDMDLDMEPIDVHDPPQLLDALTTMLRDEAGEAAVPGFLAAVAALPALPHAEWQAGAFGALFEALREAGVPGVSLGGAVLGTPPLEGEEDEEEGGGVD
ncbi:hypothetical protein C7974DRAFT_122069 [Boeremia exigua]|uniref:uncharacterized protein n=1 Tax=Boeremia exigua TaxID=749465 RepID=UPI001E8DF2BE|nr:uncharacterized protein C7974DRAFT_122069 [Boeremia exigua]KAH6638824.1 hypothetical protein C7974DRAFT_122069 [Boeremia exigua]